MSRLPSRKETGYQPLQGGGLPPRPSSGQGLFDRRAEPRRPPPPRDQGEQNSYDHMYSMDRRPLPSSQSQSHNPGFLSQLNGRGQESPKQQGGVFRVAKVFITF